MYASLGRIKKLIIFDKQSQLGVGSGQTPAEVFEDLLTNYQEYFAKFPFTHAVDIYIFFDLDGMQINRDADSFIRFQKVKLENHKSNLYFVCANPNRIEAANRLQTQWVQDILIPSGNNVMHYCSNGRVPEFLVHRLNNIFPEKKLVPLKKQCDGGNILRGRYEGRNYAIIGRKTYMQLSPDELETVLQTPKAFCFEFAPQNKNGTPVGNLLYHLDLYLTILGPGKVCFANPPEYLFLAHAIGRQKAARDINESVAESKVLFLNSQNIPLCIFIKLPLLLFELRDLPVNSPLKTYIASYNNCVVENYVDEAGQRRIYIFFPDYRMALLKLASRYNRPVAENSTAFKITADNVADMRIQIRIAFEQIRSMFSQNAPQEKEDYSEYEKARYIKLFRADKDLFFDQLKNDIHILFNTIESGLRGLEKNLGLDGIFFISYPFSLIEDSRNGSLHCLTLVAERDLVG